MVWANQQRSAQAPGVAIEKGSQEHLCELAKASTSAAEAPKTSEWGLDVLRT